jgi:hypothetical protein
MHGRRARINNSLFETLRAKEAGLLLTIVDDECPHCGFRPVVQIKQLKRTKKAVPRTSALHPSPTTAMIEDLETLSQEGARRSEPWHSSVRTCALSLRSCSSRSRHCLAVGADPMKHYMCPDGSRSASLVQSRACTRCTWPTASALPIKGDQGNPERSHSSGLCLQTSATEFFKRHAVFQCVLRSPSRLGSGQVQPPALRVGS